MSIGRGSRSTTPPTKTVVIFRNGDAFYPGRRFVVNQRQSSTFDSFLNTVTRVITAPFGAVRNIYTLKEGHRVVDLEQLVHGEIYVAAGTEKLKKLDYHHITTQKPEKKKSELIRPVVHSRIIVPARWKRISNEPCTINVFTNGEILAPPARVLIPKHTLASWENVLAMVTEKVHLRTGAVHGLCTLNGKRLRGACELQSSHYYVAVGAERFQHLPYYQLVPSKGVIHDLTNAITGDILPALKRGKQDRESFAKPEVDNDSVFYARSSDQAKQPRQASKIPGLFSAAEKSVFKATNKRKETVTSSEVLEDETIKVDLPIEQIKAEEVEEEQYFHKDSQLELDGDNPSKVFTNHPNSRSPLSGSHKTSEHASCVEESEGDSQLNSHGDSKNKTVTQPEPVV
ncbi:doublecortin domain-containing protein 2C-like [Misgurnus anguillicaudatus]|uniref:doublecortin domain-containing protein 2C-like n=1 Tax=Misgurnus anguillicaudatus TaxID=75329 RepID=UPI003CCF393F